MSELVDEDIREYNFPTPGYIPGIPGKWSGGSRVTVRESTKEVLEVWPKPVVIEAASQADSASIEGQVEGSVLSTPPAMPVKSPVEPVQQVEQPVQMAG